MTLKENPRGGILEAAHQQVRLDVFSDLVKEGIVGSDAVLNHMLEAAKTATNEALTNRSTFTPFVPVRGTTQPDLRRLGTFIAASPDANPGEQSTFWRLARDVPPSAVANLKASTKLTEVGLGRFSNISKFLFTDVTIETNGVLQVTGTIQVMLAKNVLIKKGGRIMVNGGGFQVKATSIQGEQ
jgi:hypothetical protein